MDPYQSLLVYIQENPVPAELRLLVTYDPSFPLDLFDRFAFEEAIRQRMTACYARVSLLDSEAFASRASDPFTVDTGFAQEYRFHTTTVLGRCCVHLTAIYHSSTPGLECSEKKKELVALVMHPDPGQWVSSSLPKLVELLPVLALRPFPSLGERFIQDLDRNTSPPPPQMFRIADDYSNPN